MEDMTLQFVLMLYCLRLSDWYRHQSRAISVSLTLAAQCATAGSSCQLFQRCHSLRGYAISILDISCLISSKSRKIELAVSMPPAPRPIIVCWPECSELNVIAFRVPFTHNGSSREISCGATSNSLLHDAISFTAELFLAAFLMSDVVTSLIPMRLMSFMVTFMSIIQLANMTSLAAASKPSMSNDSSASTYPFFFASASAVLNVIPLAMLVSM